MTEEKSSNKVTPDSIIKEIMNLDPNQVLKFISQQYDSEPKAFLIKHLLPFIGYVVKNGYVKTKDLAGSIKNIGDKNKDDQSGIDYDNIEIDKSSVNSKYAFDEDTINKLKTFIDDYKKSMEQSKDDIEKSSEELNKDINKAGVKIEGEKLADNALTVAGVIDDKENKGKSGKELTKIVDLKIEDNKKMDELVKKSEQTMKMIDNIKVDPKYEKMDDEQLAKLSKTTDDENSSEKKSSSLKKSTDQKSSGSMDDMRKKLRTEVLKKVSESYKNSVQAGIFKKDDFIDVFQKSGFTNAWATKSLKMDYVVAVKVEYKDAEADKVVGEKEEARYKVNILKGTEKNKGLKKITDYLEKAVTDVLGKDNIGKMYKYRKRWSGKAEDGKLDQIYVFASYKGEGLEESLNENVIGEAVEKYISPEMRDAIRDFAKSHDGYIQDSDATDFIRKTFGKNALKDILGSQVSLRSIRRDELGALFNAYREGKGTLASDRFIDLNANSATIQSIRKMISRDTGFGKDIIDSISKDVTEKIKNAKTGKAILVALDQATKDRLEKMVSSGPEGALKATAELAKITGGGTLNALSAILSMLDGKEWYENASSDMHNALGQDMSHISISGADELADTLKNGDVSKASASDAVSNILENNNDSKWTDPETYKLISGQIWSKGIYSYSTIARDLNLMQEEIFVDGNIDDNDMKKLISMSTELSELQKWASENANSTDEGVQARIAGILKLSKRFNTILTDNKQILSQDQAEALAGRTQDAANNSKEIAKVANTEETKKVTSSWLGKVGKALRVYGQALAVAKIGKFILNDGKAGVDAIGSQWVKFKEDLNVIALMTCILMNADNSDSKHSDTKFSVRFDTYDMKWHATNLDDRKAKIEKEDVLITKLLDTDEGKEFKKQCLDTWTEILEPKDEALKFIPYFIKNYENLGVKIPNKNMKKYFTTLSKLADNFDEVKKQFA